MENIKFIGRGKEVKLINELTKNNFFLVVKGRRRIGKTTLLKKSLHKAIYIFVWPDKSIDWILEQISKEYRIPKFVCISDALNYLIDKKFTIIIDEFQNFYNIDKSVYGEIQKLVDERKTENKFIKLGVAGSSYSLMNKVFNDVASPLYGRRTHEIILSHLPVVELYKTLGVSMEEFIKLWSVFEGVPYYYELINLKQNAEKNITRLIVSKNAQLQEEGKAVLSIEFGKDSKTYSTILTAISEGKTKLSEIASLFGNKKQEVIKYLSILRKDYNLVRRLTPIIQDPKKSKEGKYELSDNFLSFWFYFVDRQKNYIEQERFREVELVFKNDFNKYLGRKFEKFCLLLIKDNILKLPFKFMRLGRQWGRIPKAEKGKNQYEIDLVALNDDKKEIGFFEIKWKDLKEKQARKIIKELKEKSKFVDWNSEDRKEYFGLIGKKIEGKNKLRKEGFLVYDLKDF